MEQEGETSNIEKSSVENIEKAKQETTPPKDTVPDEEDKSALQGSIKTYGQNSYYYAHKPVDFDVGKGK